MLKCDWSCSGKFSKKPKQINLTAAAVNFHTVHFVLLVISSQHTSTCCCHMSTMALFCHHRSLWNNACLLTCRCGQCHHSHCQRTQRHVHFVAMTGKSAFTIHINHSLAVLLHGTANATGLYQRPTCDHYHVHKTRDTCRTIASWRDY